MTTDPTAAASVSYTTFSVAHCITSGTFPVGERYKVAVHMSDTELIASEVFDGEDPIHVSQTEGELNAFLNNHFGKDLAESACKQVQQAIGYLRQQRRVFDVIFALGSMSEEALKEKALKEPSFGQSLRDLRIDAQRAATVLLPILSPHQAMGRLAEEESR